MRLILCSILFTLAAIAQADVVRKKSLSILFIGNSLTYYNSLPDLLKEIAAMDDTTIEYMVVAKANYSLEDHWNEGTAQKWIATGKYNIVIGQQGPSALPESLVLLKRFAEKFAGVCKQSGKAWGLYMVWPSKDRSFDLDNVIASYTQSAKTTSGLLCPAGLAWKIAWAEDPTLPLYGPDQFHPSVTGSVLAAMTIYTALQSKDDLDFLDHKKASWKNQITLAQWPVLKRAAISAVRVP